MTKKKKILLGCLGFIVGAGVIFLVTSLCLASAHGLPLVEEWQSWGKVAETSAVLTQIVH